MPEVAFETVDYAVENPFEIRKENFPNEITFYGPGLKPHITSEFSGSLKEFISISVTGNNCALNCEHCNTKILFVWQRVFRKKEQKEFWFPAGVILESSSLAFSHDDRNASVLNWVW
jgi:hypothetical protein